MLNFSFPPAICQSLSRCSRPIILSRAQSFASAQAFRMSLTSCVQPTLHRCSHFTEIRRQYGLQRSRTTYAENHRVQRKSAANQAHAEDFRLGGDHAGWSRIAGHGRFAKLQNQLVVNRQNGHVTFAGGTQESGRTDVTECADGPENHPTDDGKTKQSETAYLGEEEVKVLAQYVTRYNFVRVLEVSRNANHVLAGARVLLLDKPGNIHSIYHKYRLLTDSYYDILAALPAVIPEGPVGILGLGAGTAARLIHHFWPEIDMHGWELDPGVIQVARMYFYLEELEWKDEEMANEGDGAQLGRRRDSGGSYRAWKDERDDVRLHLLLGTETASGMSRGRLRVHEGDALSPDAFVEGGFAGIIVDMFAEGAVIPALQNIETWRQMREKLRPGGRIIVNCGGSCVEAAGVEKKDGAITMRKTISALAQAFPGELSILSLTGSGASPSDNSVALTGPTPDLELWKNALPECLRRGIEDWRAWSNS